MAEQSKPIKPYVGERPGKRRFHVPPQDRYENMCRVRPEEPPRRQIYGCKDENRQGQVTVSMRFAVVVKELVYPGGPDDVEEVLDKWVYVFRDNKLAAKAQPDPDKFGAWRVEDIAAGQSRVCREGIELDPGPPGNRYTYVFFLSPVQLTDKALSTLTSGRSLTTAAVSASCDRWKKTVYVSDPFRWAADAHRLYYLPSLAAAQKLATDEKIHARLFIAGVLSSWVAKGDPQDIRDVLQRGQPEKFVEDHKKKLEQLWEAAEAAAAYVAYCVDSVEHSAVEEACIERGERDLSTAYHAVAAVTEGLIQTRAGRMLARHLALDAPRLPARYIFCEPELRPDITSLLKNLRWTSLAAAKILADVLPVMFSALRKRPSKVVMQKEVLKYLKNIGITDSKTVRRELRTQLPPKGATGRDLTPESPKHPKTARAFNGLAAGDEAERAFVTRHDQSLHSKHNKWHGYHRWVVTGYAWTAGTFFELINLALAVNEHVEAKAAGKEGRGVSILGASSDLSSHVLECVAELVRRQLPQRILKGVAGVAAVVGSVVDAIEFYEEVGKAEAGYEYGKARGHKLQTLGAGLSAISGGLLVAKAVIGVGAAFLGPVGVVVAVLGAVLVLSGSVMAALLQLTPSQRFARVSFLGDTARGKPIDLPWSVKKLPAPDNPITESEVLVSLLANFTVSARAWVLFVEPGAVTEESLFEVRLFWRGGRATSAALPATTGKDAGPLDEARPGSPVTAMLQAEMRTGRIVQTSGPWLRSDSAVVRDSNGVVTQIKIGLEGAVPSEASVLGEPDEVWVRHLLRQRKDDDWTIPPNEKHLRLVLPTSERASSLDEKVQILAPKRQVPKRAI